jgi:hypothetical protein
VWDAKRRKEAFRSMFMGEDDFENGADHEDDDKVDETNKNALGCKEKEEKKSRSRVDMEEIEGGEQGKTKKKKEEKESENHDDDDMPYMKNRSVATDEKQHDRNELTYKQSEQGAYQKKESACIGNQKKGIG